MVVVSGFDSAREGREHEAAKGMIVATEKCMSTSELSV